MPRRVTAVLERKRHPRWLQTVLAVTAAALLLNFFFGGLARNAIRDLRTRRSQGASLLVVQFGDSDAGIDKGYHRFYRYEYVPIRIAVADAGGNPVKGAKPTVRVFREFHVRDAGRRAEVPLRYDAAAGEWRGNWLMPFGTEPGIYTVRCDCRIPAKCFPGDYDWSARKQSASGDDPTSSRLRWARPDEGGGAQPSAAAQAPYRPAPDDLIPVTTTRDFEVAGRTPPDDMVGFGAVSWEAVRPDILQSKVTLPNGRQSDWTGVFSWLDLYGADTLWYSGLVTDARFGSLPAESPWFAPAASAVGPIGQEAQRRGYRFGVYAFAYRMHGPPELLPYDKGAVSRSGDVEIVVPSMLDERRVDDLAAAAKWLDENPNVDMIGLDYIRDTVPSFDAVDRFVEEVAPQVPPGWESFNHEKREEWLRKECDRWRDPSPTVWFLWNWWRAHRMAEVVRDIRARSHCRKPLWVFTLSWRHGMEHGQDPFMFLDAGASFDAVMLYQIESVERFEAMMTGHPTDSWREYSRKGALNIVPGDQVDFRWHQRTLDPPAPAEFHRRIVRALEVCDDLRAPVGVFCHDVARTMGTSAVGPYSGKEWALAGASAMTAVRTRWGTIPVEASLSCPETARPGQAISGTVTVRNRAGKPLRDVAVATFGTPGVAPGVGTLSQPVTIAGGEQVDLPVSWEIGKCPPGRAGKVMLSARIIWSTPDWFPSATVFQYTTVE